MKKSARLLTDTGKMAYVMLNRGHTGFIMKKTTLFLSLATLLGTTTGSFGIVNVSSLDSTWGNTSSYIFKQNGLSVVENNACKDNVIDLLNKDSNGSYPYTNSLACIGFSRAKGCDPKATNGGGHNDEYVTLMMLATEINAHGARFCPVQVLARNTNKSHAWLKYQNNLGGGTEDSMCVWLCQDGWRGDACMTDVKNTTDQFVDETPLYPSNFDSIAVYNKDGGYNTNIPSFNNTTKLTCYGKDAPEEHEMPLAVVGWLDSGKGAWVRKIITRSVRSGWKDMISYPYMYPAPNTQPILLCKRGYKHNADHTDCIGISELAEAKKKDAEEQRKLESAPSCVSSNGIYWDSFDATQHEKIMAKYGNEDCYTYKCADSLKGFTSKTNHTCVDCSATSGKIIMSNGVCKTVSPCSNYYSSFDGTKHTKRIKNPDDENTICYEYRCSGFGEGFQSDTQHASCIDCSGDKRKFGVTEKGVCVKCPSGYLFVDDASKNYCKEAEEIGRDRLLYGAGGTAANKISDQCWTFSSNEDYQTCVKDGPDAAKEQLKNRLNNETTVE